MKYLTIKGARYITIRYVLIVGILWVLISLFKADEWVNFSIPTIGFSLDFKVIRPHIVAISVILLGSFIASHALAYKVSRWVNNGKRPFFAAFRAILISWTLVSLVVMYIVNEFGFTTYTWLMATLPLLLAPLVSWEFRISSRVKPKF